MPTTERLIETGLRLLETPDAGVAEYPKARRGDRRTLYTHSAGMAGTYDALVRQAFVLFGEVLAAVTRADEAVTEKPFGRR